MKKKKIFQSKSVNRLVLLERLTWLVPVGVFLWNIWQNRELVRKILEEDSSLPVIIAIIAMYVLSTFVQSLVPFFVLKLLFHCARKQMVRNSTFRTVEDFEYYRDKLEGLSPGAISLISDLKLEQKKDVAASILKYKEMGILKEVDGKFVAEHLEQTNLRESDTYLIDKLVHHTFSVENDKEWQRLVEQEAVADGYIARRGDLGGKGCGGCLLTVIIPIVLFVIVFILCSHVLENMEGLEHILAQAKEGMSLGEQLEYLSQYPQYFPLIAEIVGIFILLCIALVSPLAVIAGIIGTAMNVKWFKRTALGNEMAECIYGMKNFIHDYSNLSQADQEQVVLWDDYLIYAVVLEENQQIVDDIMKRRKNVWDT